MSGWKRVGKKTNISWKGCRREIRIGISVDCTAANAAIEGVVQRLANLKEKLTPFNQAMNEAISSFTCPSTEFRPIGAKLRESFDRVRYPIERNPEVEAVERVAREDRRRAVNDRLAFALPRWNPLSRNDRDDWFVEEPQELCGSVDEAIAQVHARSERRQAAIRSHLGIEQIEQEYTVEFLDRPHRRMSLDEILSPEEMRQIRRVSTVEQVNQVRQMLQERLRVGDRDISFRGEIGGRLEIRVVGHEGESDSIFVTDSADFRDNTNSTNADVERLIAERETRTLFDRLYGPPISPFGKFTSLDCRHHTGERLLPCAVNPCGQCEGCQDYKAD